MKATVSFASGDADPRLDGTHGDESLPALWR
jgi:hypothetical protein